MAAAALGQAIIYTETTTTRQFEVDWLDPEQLAYAQLPCLHRCEACLHRACPACV